MSSWADDHIAKLRAGESVSFRPKGTSMRPRIESGQRVTVEPVSAKTPLGVGDIVLCHVRGRAFLHLIKAIGGTLYEIGNNRGGINGWISRAAIYGKCVRIES